MSGLPDWLDLARLDAVDPLPGWEQYGACVALGPRYDLFFPERGASVKAARTLCERCACRYACLADGLYEKFGIRAGTTERQRREIRRQLVEYRAGRAA